MSIDSEQPGQSSITEGDRALSLFTDRYQFTRLLAERINEPPDKRILFFHGAGGNGKSLLLKYLQQTVCRRLSAEQWQQAKALTDAELAGWLENLPLDERLKLPAVLLDFESRPALNEVQPKDRFYGLLVLRKALGEAVEAGNYRLKFARYDFACIWYLHSKGKSLDEIRSLFPLNEVAGLATTTLDAIMGNPIGAFAKAALDFGVEDWSERLTLLFARQGVDKETQAYIRGLDLDRELVEELPKLFADDLNAAMRKSDAPERVVFFFDTHEAFWGEQRDLPPASYFFRDEWLRRLLRRLNLSDGIVVVLAGRDRPLWAKAQAVQPGTEIPAQYVQLEEVGHLSAADARAYLQKVLAGTTVEAAAAYGALCEGLVTFASVNPYDAVDEREVHPLHLGLCADVVLEAATQGTLLSADDFAQVPEFDAKGGELIERLLLHVSESLRYAIHALSACRAFDREIYKLLGEKLNFVADEPTFRRLVSFSFVWRAQQRGDEWYRIHDLLRRLDDAPDVRLAHEVLAEHFLSQSVLECIYHINQLSWVQGISLWSSVFEQALELSRYETCRTLLDLRRELNINAPFKLGIVSYLEAQYFQKISQHKAAWQEYEEAIAAYDEGLKQDPHNSTILNNKALSLQGLANSQALLSKHQIAQQTYEASITACDAALELTPDLLQALNNKGIVLQHLANLQATLAQYQRAEQTYKASIATYDAVLKLSPENVGALNNKGLSLQCLADLQAILFQHQHAEQTYKASIAVYDDVLKVAPNLLQALNNKGNLLSKLGDLQVERSQYRLAQQMYEASISTYDAALKLSSNDLYVLTNKGNSLNRLADLQSKLSMYQLAQQTYEASIVSYNAVLELAPDDVYVLNNKGLLLQHLADLQSKLSMYQLAQQTYETSIATYNHALERAPDSVETLSNKGLLLQHLANFSLKQEQLASAVSCFETARLLWQRALEIAPDSRGLKKKFFHLTDYLQSWLARVQVVIAEQEAGQNTEDLDTLLSYGRNLNLKSRLHLALSQAEAAIETFRAIVELYSQKSLSNNSECQSVLGAAYVHLANLHYTTNPSQSDAYAQQALTAWNKAVELAPDNPDLKAARDNLSAQIQNDE